MVGVRVPTGSAPASPARAARRMRDAGSGVVSAASSGAKPAGSRGPPAASSAGGLLYGAPGGSHGRPGSRPRRPGTGHPGGLHAGGRRSTRSSTSFRWNPALPPRPTGPIDMLPCAQTTSTHTGAPQLIPPNTEKPRNHNENPHTSRQDPPLPRATPPQNDLEAATTPPRRGRRRDRRRTHWYVSGTVRRPLVEMVGARGRPGQIQSFLRMSAYTATAGTTTRIAADTRPDRSPAPG